MVSLIPRGTGRTWGPWADERGEEGRTSKHASSRAASYRKGSRQQRQKGLRTQLCFQNKRTLESHTLFKDFDGWTTPPISSSCSRYQPLRLSQVSARTSPPQSLPMHAAVHSGPLPPLSPHLGFIVLSVTQQSPEIPLLMFITELPYTTSKQALGVGPSECFDVLLCPERRLKTQKRWRIRCPKRACRWCNSTKINGNIWFSGI